MSVPALIEANPSPHFTKVVDRLVGKTMRPHLNDINNLHGIFAYNLYTDDPTAFQIIESGNGFDMHYTAKARVIGMQVIEQGQKIQRKQGPIGQLAVAQVGGTSLYAALDKRLAPDLDFGFSQAARRLASGKNFSARNYVYAEARRVEPPSARLVTPLPFEATFKRLHQERFAGAIDLDQEAAKQLLELTVNTVTVPTLDRAAQAFYDATNELEARL